MTQLNDQERAQQLEKLTNDHKWLRRTLYQLEQKELNDKFIDHQQKQYEAFQQRQSCFIIGKAHSNIGAHYGLPYINTDHGGERDQRITSTTQMYLHNVWTSKQRNDLQKAMNECITEELHNAIGDLENTLILLGQQYEKLDEFLEDMPADKHDKIKDELWAETCKVLSNYSLDDFTTLANSGIVFNVEVMDILDRYSDETF